VSANDAVLWDRKVMGRFPESKEVKQLVRDIVDPSKDLGHSDVGAEKNIVVGGGDCIECKEREANEKKGEGKVQEDKEQSPPLRQQQQSILAAPSSLPPLPSIISNNQQQNRIFIEYSTGGGSIDSPDNGLYRAAYYANELLSMVYKRNAWWKRRRQLELDDDVDNRDENNDAMPIVVDSVSFIPVRLDGDLLVSIASQEFHMQTDEDAI
jgi:predicted Rdx family selenoprotein